MQQLRLLAHPPEDYLAESLREASAHGLDMEILLGRHALEEFDLAMKIDPFCIDLDEFISLQQSQFERKYGRLGELPSHVDTQLSCGHFPSAIATGHPSSAVLPATTSASLALTATPPVSSSQTPTAASNYNAVAAHIGSAVPAIAQAAAMARVGRFCGLNLDMYGKDTGLFFSF